MSNDSYLSCLLSTKSVGRGVVCGFFFLTVWVSKWDNPGFFAVSPQGILIFFDDYYQSIQDWKST